MAKTIVHVAFWFICGSLTVYSAVRQFIRYNENADTPKISFKQFDQSPDDIYPDITLCFDGYRMKKHLYDNFYLQKYHSISKSDYQELLSGDAQAWKDATNGSAVAEIDFEKAALKLKDLVLHLENVASR